MKTLRPCSQGVSSDLFSVLIPSKSKLFNPSPVLPGQPAPGRPSLPPVRPDSPPSARSRLAPVRKECAACFHSVARRGRLQCANTGHSTVAWRAAWDEGRADSIGFIDFLNFILQFAAIASSPDRKEPPISRHALKFGSAVIAKVQSGTRHEILDGARRKHLSRRSQRGDAGTDVDRDPAHVVAHYLAFSGVKAGAHLEPQRLDSL
jgi:hypothetical protein